MQLYTEFSEFSKVSCRGGKRPCNLPTCRKILEEKSRFYCSKCKFAVYCDTECQKQDWKEHKSACLLFSTHPKANEILEQRKIMHTILATAIGFVSQLFKINDPTTGIVVVDADLTVSLSTKDLTHLKFKFIPFTEIVIGKTTTDTQLEYMKGQVSMGRRIFGMLIEDYILQCTSYTE